MEAMRCLSPIKSYGSKGYKCRILDAFLPADAATRLLLEPYFGSGAFFFAFKSRFRTWAVNDLSHSIMTFFRVLRDRPEELEQKVLLTPYCYAEFVRAMERSDDDLEEARRVWVRSRQSFSGLTRHTSNWSRSAGRSREWRPKTCLNAAKKLRKAARTLMDVSIDSIDATEFIGRWARDGSFSYLDPPYVSSTRPGNETKYELEMTDDQHRAMLDAVLVAAGRYDAKFLVSNYANPIYDEKLAGWGRHVWKSVTTCNRDQRKNTREEVVWFN